MSSQYDYDWHWYTANIPTQIAFTSLQNEQIYEVDLSSREIAGPEVLSIQEDHNAELILFETDRYHDHVDLASMCCVIQFNTKNIETGEPFHGVYPIQFFDIVSHQGKIIIPWSVPRAVTQSAQEIEYNIRFFAVNKEESTIDYNLNTLPTSTKILSTIQVYDDAYSVDWPESSASYNYEVLVDMYNKISRDGLFWQDASDLLI